MTKEKEKPKGEEFERPDFIALYKELIEESLNNLAKSAKQYHEDANESEGKMQSRYDTYKEELSAIADGLQRIVSGKRQRLETNTSSDKEEFDQELEMVDIGSVVTLVDQEFETTNTILILPEQLEGGGRLELDDISIIGVNINSPLAGAVIGKQKGDEFTYSVEDMPISMQVVSII